MSTVADTTHVAASPASSARIEAQETNKFAAKALEDHKREGLLLAVRARWAALAIIDPDGTLIRVGRDASTIGGG